jgi:hypothetical protein
MAAHLDTRRARLYGRGFRWTTSTRFWTTVVSMCVVPLGFLSPIDCSRWTGKEEPPPMPPVVIAVGWSAVLSNTSDLPLGIGGELMTWSAKAPHHTEIRMLYEGTVEGHPAKGYSVWADSNAGPASKEVYRVLCSVVREEGHPIVVIEGTSEVAWQLKVTEEGNNVIVAQQGDKESALPLDLQPGPFHIRIEAREQKETKQNPSSMPLPTTDRSSPPG